MSSDFSYFLPSDTFLSCILLLFLSMLSFHLFPFSSPFSNLRSLSPRIIWNDILQVLLTSSRAQAHASKTKLERAIYSFQNYEHLSILELTQMQKSYSRINREHKRIGYEIGYPAKLERLEQAIKTNALLTAAISKQASDELDLDISALGSSTTGLGIGGACQGELREVREALLHFVRDWSDEGEKEREVVMRPILEAMKELEPEEQRRKDMRVLVPGCGLGRLAWEVSQLGFTAHANEVSPYMIASLRFLFSSSNTTRPKQHTLHPYAHWFSHQRSNQNLFRPVCFPDVEVLPRLSSTFRFIPGDFLQLKPRTKSEPYDVIITQFFIDTSYNIIGTLQQIHALLKPNGTWINLGPLLWRSNAQAALELSLEEVLELVKKVGFEVDEGRRRAVECEYTADKEAMMRWVYKAEFWVARKC